ncbi:MAG: hypothetical protein ACREBZ_02840 [Thermoplasmata archaeon]
MLSGRGATKNFPIVGEPETMVGEPETMVNLSGLKTLVSTVDSTLPIYTLVRNLPTVMRAEEYAALVPTLWALAERT